MKVLYFVAFLGIFLIWDVTALPIENEEKIESEPVMKRFLWNNILSDLLHHMKKMGPFGETFSDFNDSDLYSSFGIMTKLEIRSGWEIDGIKAR